MNKNDRAVEFTIGSVTYNSASLGLQLIDVEIGSPPPKIMKMDIPFRHGALDLTEYFSSLGLSVRFRNRTINMDFIITDNEHIDVFEDVRSKLNGKQADAIVFSYDDSGEYYVGRLTVGNLKHAGAYWRFSISADCEPFKGS